jgi:hypothetical protein
MVVIDAVWEKRNLGLNTIEIVIEPTDTLKDFNLHHYNADYEVIKIPIELKDWVFGLQNLGYTFVEVLNNCKFSGNPPILNKIENRMLSNISCSIMDSTEIQLLKKNIFDGMFNTDRISMDPFFGLNIAANRYWGWINDEMNNGAQLFNLKFKNHPAGFFILKKIQNNIFSNLAGIYNHCQNKGLGLFLNYSEILEGWKMGGEILYTAYSSNNLGADKIHNALRFTIYKQFYVFIKHNKQ